MLIPQSIYRLYMHIYIYVYMYVYMYVWVCLIRGKPPNRDGCLFVSLKHNPKQGTLIIYTLCVSTHTCIHLHYLELILFEL